MRLPRFHRQPFVHHGSQREFVREAGVNARHRDRPRFSTTHDRLAQRVSPVGPGPEGRLRGVHDGAECPRGVGFAADGFDAAVRTAPSGHLLERFVHVDFFEVDRLGLAVLRGHRQPFGNAVDSDHPPRPEHPRALDRELGHRAAAPDRDRVALFDTRVLGRHVPGREDVREEQDLLVGQARFDFDRPDVGVRHAQKLGLAAGVPAEHVRKSEQAGRGVAHSLGGNFRVGVGGIAGGVERLRAEVARSAGDGEGDDDAVPLLELRHFATDFDDDAHRLVAQDVAALHRRLVAVEEVEIRAADRGRGDPDDDVGRLFDDGIGDGVDADIAGTVPAERFHEVFSRCEWVAKLR